LQTLGNDNIGGLRGVVNAGLKNNWRTVKEKKNWTGRARNH